MKIKMLVGLGCVLLASSAGASVVTPGSDFDGVDGDVAHLARGIFGAQYQGTTQATAIGGLKRSPATAADGSQTVSIQFGGNAGSVVNGAIWSFDLDFFFMHSFSGTVAASSGLTKTITIPAAELTNTSYLVGVTYLKPNQTVFGATVN